MKRYLIKRYFDNKLIETIFCGRKKEFRKRGDKVYIWTGRRWKEFENCVVEKIEVIDEEFITRGIGWDVYKIKYKDLQGVINIGYIYLDSWQDHLDVYYNSLEELKEDKRI